MPRIRSISPGFFDDEDVAGLSMEARLLFVGLWTQADRAGRLEDRPARLKARLFPYDEVDLEPRLAELHAGRFIIRYAVDGVRLIQIRQFRKHQHPHVKEAASALPEPAVQGQQQASPVLEQVEPGASPVLAPVEPVGLLSLGTGSGSGGVGERRLKPKPKPKPKRQAAFASPEEATRYARWYAAYPRKEKNGAAERAFRKLDPDDAAVDLWIGALERQRAAGYFACERRFIPLPANWLGDRRWEDELPVASASASSSSVQRRVEESRAEGAAGLAHQRAVLEGRA